MIIIARMGLYAALINVPAGKLSDDDLAHYECCIHAAMEHFGIKEHEYDI